MKIYAIATEITECYGQGSYGVELAIRQEDAYSGNAHFLPLFYTEEQAQEYLDAIQFKENKKIIALEVQGINK
jgi:hypothetical protein